MYMYMMYTHTYMYLYKEPDSVELSHGLSVLWRPGQQMKGSHTHLHHLIHVHTILHTHTFRNRYNLILFTTTKTQRDAVQCQLG